MGKGSFVLFMHSVYNHASSQGDFSLREKLGRLFLRSENPP